MRAQGPGQRTGWLGSGATCSDAAATGSGVGAGTAGVTARVTLPRSRRTESQRIKSAHLLAARTTPQQRRAASFARWRNRAVEAADCQTAAHAIRAFFGEARPADRAVGTTAGSAAAERCGESRCSTRTNRERRAGDPTNTTTVASTSTAGSADLSTKARSLPGLRWRAEASWRRCFGDAGNRIDPLQSDPPGSSQDGMRGCDRIVQAEAPSRPIARGVAGPGLLAHVLASKFADHLPLYRQSEIYARQGVELDRSTLADWVCGTSQLFEPLVEALRRHVMAAQKLHADDTPVPVLAPGNGKTKTGQTMDLRTRRSAGRRRRRLRRCGSLTHRIARANTRRPT